MIINKKITLFFIMSAFVAMNVRGQLRQKLVERMTQLQARGYMMGHQDDTFYGINWEWDEGRSDIRETCGDYPAVMGFDLGGIEKGDLKNLDSVPFTRIRREIVAHANRGGIVTLSWHPRNPLTGGTAWDKEGNTTVKSILPGGDKHLLFLDWMNRVRDFLNSLRFDNGRPVPFIFRPWHENNGDWFWWGSKQCTPEEYKALWCMLQDYLLHEGMDNIVWSYSPNITGSMTEDYVMQWYPGNARVDLIGLDAYQWGTEEDFIKQTTNDLDCLAKMARKNGKLLALTECGLKNLTNPNWWNGVLKPIADKFPISYALGWRNYKLEYFMPAKGEPSEADFVKLYKAANTLFLEDIK